MDIQISGLYTRNRTSVRVDGQLLPVIDCESSYKYLGVEIFGASRVNSGVPMETLMKGLRNMTKAPLKPQQRMFLLRIFLVPAVYHKLVFSPLTAGFLDAMDLEIRRSVKEWLKLPLDATDAYIYSHPDDGGLGVPCLRTFMPALRRDRLQKLTTSHDPVVAAMVRTSTSLAEWIKQVNDLGTLKGQDVSSATASQRTWRERLYNTVDGSGLKEFRQAPLGSSSWVTSGTRLLTGCGYIKAIHMRGATLKTRYRCARGFPNMDTSCDSCGRTETLGHILQVCPRTSQTRIKRHHRVTDLALKQLKLKGLNGAKEVTIPTAEGVRRQTWCFGRTTRPWWWTPQ